ncbi:phage tail protein [Brevibacillus fulvus]|uniref:Microcystin-dependent protein n=1 Tax=Brevibacillus fulvus TaxID=1125967 RepID=A0A939BVR8_9BACL|nr:tail fiber protein [Brevibacillus fulvus]MBM7591724.1 microcystin-dependent protein [Brevibacillus fulvus]
MPEPFLGEIRIFSGNFAPHGWAFCNGQLLLISQNTALFSILGVMYGGDGKTTFALPNLNGRAPMQWGQGPGLQARAIGETGGAATVTLTGSQVPRHSHLAKAGSIANSATPVDSVWANGSRYGEAAYVPSPNGTQTLNAQALNHSGATAPHNNQQPYLATNFIIALQGVFPSRG